MRSRASYGQFCPVAKAAEILAERWTPLVVRELLYGSRHFSELQRGLPLMSPTVLAQRLRELEDAGVVEREAAADQRRARAGYRLTAAGQELQPVIEQLGRWGRRWAVDELRPEDLEPAYLTWAMHRCLRTEPLGPARVVIAHEIVGAAANRRRWWLVVTDGQVDICLKHPGFKVDVTITAAARPLADLCLGRLDPDAARRSGAIAVEGAPLLVRRFRDWYPRSPLANESQGRRASAPALGKSPVVGLKAS